MRGGARGRSGQPVTAQDKNTRLSGVGKTSCDLGLHGRSRQGARPRRQYSACRRGNVRLLAVVHALGLGVQLSEFNGLHRVDRRAERLQQDRATIDELAVKAGRDPRSILAWIA